jgi:hypothetical protein
VNFGKSTLPEYLGQYDECPRSCANLESGYHSGTCIRLCMQTWNCACLRRLAHKFIPTRRKATPAVCLCLGLEFLLQDCCEKLN